MKKPDGNIYTIYRFTNKLNGKMYIGFDSDYPSRIKSHYYVHRSKICPDYPFYNALKKYGWDNFQCEILYQSCDLEHTLDKMENFFIKENNSHTTQNGYNVTWGGQGTVGKLQSNKNKLEQSNRRRLSNIKSNWYNNGTENKFCESHPGDNWTRGRLNQKPSTKGHKWYNNGIKQILSKKCPEGYKIGMLKRDRTNE